MKTGRRYRGHLDNVCRFHETRFGILDHDTHQRETLLARARVLSIKISAEVFKRRVVHLIERVNIGGLEAQEKYMMLHWKTRYYMEG